MISFLRLFRIQQLLNQIYPEKHKKKIYKKEMGLVLRAPFLFKGESSEFRLNGFIAKDIFYRQHQCSIKLWKYIDSSQVFL